MPTTLLQLSRGGVKVLEPYQGARKLPEESHTPNTAYLLLDRHGVFHQYREYDENRYLVFEIGYHTEPSIDPSGRPVLHVHEYRLDDFEHRSPRPITQDEIENYKHLFRGADLP